MLPPSSSQSRRGAPFSSSQPAYTLLDSTFQGLLDAVGDLSQDPKQPAMAQMGLRAKTQVDAFTQAALLTSPPPATPNGHHHSSSRDFGASPRGSNASHEASPGGKARGSGTSLQHELMLGLMDGSMNGVAGGSRRQSSGGSAGGGGQGSKALLESLGGAGGRVISLLPTIDSVQHMLRERAPVAGAAGAGGGSSQQQQLSLMGMQPSQSPHSMPLFCYPTSF